MRVCVLKGGSSLERSVSLRSGARVADALEANGHLVTSIDVDTSVVDALRESKPDVVFVALHGRGGEDGTIQELLEILDLPYTGSGVAAAMRCMDKVQSKYCFADADIPTPKFFAFNETAFRDFGAASALPEIESQIGFPLVIKPAAQGSALGIKFAAGSKDVPGALVSAFSYDDRVLLEQYVEGRELSISILESGSGPGALPIVEAKPHKGTFFDFESRYELGKTDYICPAELSSETSNQLASLALRTYEVLGCNGFARVDLILDSDDRPHVLEVNAIPGLTETSLTPMAAEAAGIGFDQLIEQILQSALVRARVSA